ncbi:hemin ABC transporter substrate-binding protein [Pedobacter hiemivivus]|uniref:Hemin ABC transporter substrate-binding protein n=1 Tax=Pedobacter hiemivivus TaxID=2530454 RepID=A0A4U1GKN9_9SPHI|nr:ABC transporter substrate-binding protein [Pedobacter hiemivivus]TCC99206.1 hemin ABC transporter substrate-binding protein [Pedobacter hiemivivus]TKC63949.1 hemin ABC transporter substrate-binding protein [Pedobacter hiemivivus]
MKKSLYILLLILLGYSVSTNASFAPKRIITLSAALTETVDALGFGPQIVAIDVTSTYPAYTSKLPKVSQNRTVSTEGLISFSPDLVLSPEGGLSKATESQLKSAGIKVVILKQEFSAKGASTFIRQVAAALGATAKGEELVKKTEPEVNKALALVKENPKSPKVLFIYARGTGVMMVAGKDTNIDAIIKLAGGKNAAQGFSKFKPYTTESLVNANPDIILMFDFGYKSLGGAASILKMPGVSLTNAGKNKRIVEMDGELLTGFSTRLAQAITQLNDKW